MCVNIYIPKAHSRGRDLKMAWALSEKFTRYHEGPRVSWGPQKVVNPFKKW